MLLKLRRMGSSWGKYMHIVYFPVAFFDNLRSNWSLHIYLLQIKTCRCNVDHTRDTAQSQKWFSLYFFKCPPDSNMFHNQTAEQNELCIYILQHVLVSCTLSSCLEN